MVAQHLRSLHQIGTHMPPIYTGTSAGLVWIANADVEPPAVVAMTPAGARDLARELPRLAEAAEGGGPPPAEASGESLADQEAYLQAQGWQLIRQPGGTLIWGQAVAGAGQCAYGTDYEQVTRAAYEIARCRPRRRDLERLRPDAPEAGPIVKALVAKYGQGRN